METYFGEIEQARSRLARDRVLADLKTLARDSEDLLRVTAHDVGESSKDARSRVASALERAQATILELQEQTLATAQGAARRADIVVRAHPYQSIGAAFGLGLLVGVLIAQISRHTPPESKQS